MARKPLKEQTIQLGIRSPDDKVKHWELTDFADYEYYKDSPIFNKIFEGCTTESEYAAAFAKWIVDSKGDIDTLSEMLGVANRIIVHRCCKSANLSVEFIRMIRNAQRKRFRLPVPYPFQKDEEND